MNKSEYLRVRISPQHLAKLKRIAKRRKISVSALVLEIIEALPEDADSISSISYEVIIASMQ